MDVEQSPEKQGSARTKGQKTRSTAENQSKPAPKDCELRTDGSIETSEKSTEPTSEKSDKTNPEDPTESAKEKSIEDQRIIPVTQVLEQAGERHSGTEADTTLGRKPFLGVITAQPITTVPPTSEIGKTEPITLAEVMEAIN